MLLFLQRCVWGIPSFVIRRCITGRLISEFWKKGIAFRTSGMNYRVTQRRIPKERNSGLNYRVTLRRIPKERNWGLNYRVTPRRIPKERNTGLNYRLTLRRIPKERNSGLNYRVTQRLIPKERNSGLNYTATQQPPLHTENGGKKVLRNVSTLQDVTRQKTVIIIILVVRMPHIVRLGASKRCLHNAGHKFRDWIFYSFPTNTICRAAIELRSWNRFSQECKLALV
jgi:hypothetical protein